MIVKKILLITLLILITFCLVSPALAEIPVPRPEGASSRSLEEVISTIINILFYVVGSIAILFLIIGGFQFIVAAGNPQGIQTAKSTVLYVVIGLTIVSLSNVAVQFIIKQLTS
jgi:hypothetical protein